MGGFQLVQDQLVRMLGNVTASLCMVTRLSQLQDAGAMTDEQASLAKAFCTARRAILCSIFSVENPGVPFSTRKPFTLPSSTSRAQITTTSAKVALPIHFLTPWSTQVSPFWRAVVVRPPAAPEPTSGSVSPKAPIFSIRAIAGSHCAFCSSDPQR
ncbi:MAG: hypothetical protein E6G66_18395 [Actinobacteria bacterium]|nr:MAG: hypothetical protein E6G66_18395 [Actinomycetota bacterium]